jgi:hypothetical protein
MTEKQAGYEDLPMAVRVMPVFGSRTSCVN